MNAVSNEAGKVQFGNVDHGLGDSMSKMGVGKPSVSGESSQCCESSQC
jgi:hypothetical protein